MVMQKLECLRCGHQWLPRTEKPLACPSCRSRAWDEQRPKETKR